MLVCTGHPAIDLDGWDNNGFISPGPRLREAGGGATEREAGVGRRRALNTRWS